jgi:hypothetical protein
LVTSDGKKQGRARVMGGMASLRGKIWTDTQKNPEWEPCSSIFHTRG